MKRFVATILCLSVLAAGALFVIGTPGCSKDELEQFAKAHPQLAPTTQKIEAGQEKLDPIVDKTKQDAGAVAKTADAATLLGIPYAGYVSIGANILLAAAGLYLKRRTGQAEAAVDTLATGVRSGSPSGVTDAILKTRAISRRMAKKLA